jgi:hypothetical protein
MWQDWHLNRIGIRLLIQTAYLATPICRVFLGGGSLMLGGSPLKQGGSPTARHRWQT